MRNLFSLVLTFFLSYQLHAQYKLIETLSIPKPIFRTSIDRYDNLYVSDITGSVYKYETNTPKLTHHYSSSITEAKEIEAWNSFNTFLFSPYEKSVEILNRQMTLIQTISLESTSFETDENTLCTPASDGSFWILNGMGNLIKFSPNLAQTITESSLYSAGIDNTVTPTFIQEYQNRLYIVASDIGVIVFDNLGNQLHIIKCEGVDRVGFSGDEMYYLYDEKIHFINLYNYKKRMDEPPIKGCGSFIITENLVIGIKGNSIFFYKK